MVMKCIFSYFLLGVDFVFFYVGVEYLLKGLCIVIMVIKNCVKLGIIRKRKVMFLLFEEDMLFKKNYLVLFF